MRVLTQSSPYGRHGVAGWSMAQRLGADGSAWLSASESSRQHGHSHRLAWWRWLRALMLAMVLWTVASAAWADCTINWTVQASEQSGNTYTRELTPAEYASCDSGKAGIYSDSGGNTGQVNAADGSSMSVNLNNYPKDILVFIQAAGKTGPWTFPFYGCPAAQPGCIGPYTSNVTINVSLPQQSPTVTGISPTTGPTAGSTSVTITGTNFTGVTSVKFGATNATGFTVNSATSITATSPAGSAGVVDVTVTATGGTSATSAADQFTYVAPPITGATSATVAHGSTNNAIPLSITGGAPTSVTVSTPATHGTATASGLSLTYTPNPSFSGTDTFAYTATNAGGTSSPATITVTVSNATVTYAPSSPAAGTVGTAYSQSLASANGGTAPYTYTLASGSLPSGLSLASNGTLSGTPTTGGSFNFTVTATDSSTGTGPFSATSGPLTLTINAPTISV
ncbi:putative Ig domain-containing protein, partial [Ralstonia flaminis]|uniref:putative Ig domain-containing protein n=1 Tax=Ralstonia flaminis TaxID=3058597 RepID=UPI00292F7D36